MCQLYYYGSKLKYQRIANAATSRIMFMRGCAAEKKEDTMRIVSLDIQNFRCIKQAHIAFKSQTVLVGDNNCGKSTVLEAIDLVLGPDRMSRHPVVDEYDFFTAGSLCFPRSSAGASYAILDTGGKRADARIHYVEQQAPSSSHAGRGGGAAFLWRH